MKRTGKRAGLEINDEKTKWMRATRDRDDDEEILVVDGVQIPGQHSDVTELHRSGAAASNWSRKSLLLGPQQDP